MPRRSPAAIRRRPGSRPGRATPGARRAGWSRVRDGAGAGRGEEATGKAQAGTARRRWLRRAGAGQGARRARATAARATAARATRTEEARVEVTRGGGRATGDGAGEPRREASARRPTGATSRGIEDEGDAAAPWRRRRRRTRSPLISRDAGAALARRLQVDLELARRLFGDGDRHLERGGRARRPSSPRRRSTSRSTRAPSGHPAGADQRSVTRSPPADHAGDAAASAASPAQMDSQRLRPWDVTASVPARLPRPRGARVPSTTCGRRRVASVRAAACARRRRRSSRNAPGQRAAALLGPRSC